MEPSPDPRKKRAADLTLSMLFLSACAALYAFDKFCQDKKNQKPDEGRPMTITELEDEEKWLVEQEMYEDAAKIRDIISGIKNPPAKGRKPKIK